MKKTFVVLCPGKNITGGPEALHQLVHELNQVQGVEGLMHYLGGVSQETVAEYWDHYDIPVTESLEVPGASYVIPEKYDPAEVPSCAGRKWVWWLSARRFHPLSAYADYHHAFQSEYARARMTALGFHGVMLTDYLRETFTAPPSAAKENLVCYNGIKSPLAMVRLRMFHPAMPCVPLRGMPHEKVRETLARAKVYVDFGPHPGRDRMPREAAASGCVVITNREGAAAYDDDVPLPGELRIEDKGDVEVLYRAIVNAVEHYDGRLAALEPYRRWVAEDRKRFAAEVRAFAEADPEPPAPLDGARIAQMLTALDADWLRNRSLLELRTAIANQFAAEIEMARFGAPK